MKLQFLLPRVTLIAAGVLLGLAARAILGVPDTDDRPQRKIDRPISESAMGLRTIPLLNPDGTPVSGQLVQPEESLSGLVPPIVLPGQIPVAPHTSPTTLPGWDEFGHDPNAVFHSHGEQLCASGCALSRHPTARLTSEHYDELLQAYAGGPLDETNHALESLLFFGPQTRAMIEQQGLAQLPSAHASFLWEQLQYTHAVVSLRLVDQEGNVRSWLSQSSVPFDRRHVFDMETENLQPLVTSGTVKRVGLNHVWVRL